MENISILQELKAIYSQTPADEYLAALHVHLSKCLGFGARNNFYYFSFVRNVENGQNVKKTDAENRQNRLCMHTKVILFRRAGESKNDITFALTHTNTERKNI